MKPTHGKRIRMDPPVEEDDRSLCSEAYKQLLECVAISDDNDESEDEGQDDSDLTNRDMQGIGFTLDEHGVGYSEEEPHVAEPIAGPSNIVRPPQERSYSEIQAPAPLEPDYSDPTRRIPGEKQPLYSRLGSQMATKSTENAARFTDTIEAVVMQGCLSSSNLIQAHQNNHQGETDKNTTSKRREIVSPSNNSGIPPEHSVVPKVRKLSPSDEQKIGAGSTLVNHPVHAMEIDDSEDTNPMQENTETAATLQNEIAASLLQNGVNQIPSNGGSEANEMISPENSIEANKRSFENEGRFLKDHQVCEKIHAVVEVCAKARYIVTETHQCVLTTKSYKIDITGGCLNQNAELEIELNLKGKLPCSPAVTKLGTIQ